MFCPKKQWWPQPSFPFVNSPLCWDTQPSGTTLKYLAQHGPATAWVPMWLSPQQGSSAASWGTPLGAKSPNDIFRLQRAHCIKIQIDSSKPLPRINHYPINKEAIQGIKPIIKDYKTQGFIISCTSPWNTPILAMRKPMAKDGIFVQDLQEIKTLLSLSTLFPTPHN